jgi:protein-L-isoaspartate(D-aspartate) O-methyltransferase
MVRSQLCARDITDQRVLAVMSEVPRELFVPAGLRLCAYDDRALSIGCEQTISQPYMVAIMTQALRLKPDHRTLEIGTGSGYQTAILTRMCRRVYTVERLEQLAAEARSRLEQLAIDNVDYLVGDGSLGWTEHAPFDRILVTAGAPAVPQTLVDQLADGGLLVLPVGPLDEQILTVVERKGDRTIERPSLACRFVKLIGKAAWDA